MLLDMSDDQKTWAGSHQHSHVDINDVRLQLMSASDSH
jgi:hypothetical protein